MIDFRFGCWLTFLLFCVVSANSTELEKIEKLSLVPALEPSEINVLNFEPTKDPQIFTARSQTDDSFWIKGILKANQLNLDLIVQISNMHFNEMYLYLPRDQTYQLSGVSGNMFKKYDQQLKRFNQFLIHSNQNVFYIKTKVTKYEGFDISIQEKNQFYKAEHFEIFQLGVYYGLAIMSVVFNIVFYLVFRDYRFISYSLLLTFVFVQFIYEDGLIIYLTTNTWVLNNFIIVTAPITAFFACLFTYNFLELRHKFPSFWKIAALMLLISAISTVVYFLTGLKFGLYTANLMSITSALLCCFIAIRLFRTDILARFLITTLGVVLLFGIAYYLHQSTDLVFFEFFDRKVFKMASTFEIIIISFAIIYKVRKIQSENSYFRNEIEKYIGELNNLSELKSKNEAVRSASSQGVFAELQGQYQLTDRELDVLKGISQGMSNQQLADELFISISTVKYHVSNLYVKLDIKNRTQVLNFVHQMKNQ